VPARLLLAELEPEMLRLPVHAATRFVLVRPHYPENVGASARALKTMGFTRLVLVKPGRLAVPEHEMAMKMAVKSQDVLLSALCCNTLQQAVADADLVLATTARRGVSGVLEPRDAGRLVLEHAEGGAQVAVVFGNEKTGLGAEDLRLSHERVRIPMAADQPSVNLAQAVQLVAYALFVAALDARVAPATPSR
jgi:tRNA (cytidine32/uridine32-2'-O)-methyltransferase